MGEPDFTIMSDGDLVAVILDGEAFVARARIEASTISANVPALDVTTRDSYFKQYAAGPLSVSLAVEMIAHEMVTVLNDPEQVKHLMMYNRLTVRDVFRLINKKLDLR